MALSVSIFTMYFGLPFYYKNQGQTNRLPFRAKVIKIIAPKLCGNVIMNNTLCRLFFSLKGDVLKITHSDGMAYFL